MKKKAAKRRDLQRQTNIGEVQTPEKRTREVSNEATDTVGDKKRTRMHLSYKVTVAGAKKIFLIPNTGQSKIVIKDAQTNSKDEPSSGNVRVEGGRQNHQRGFCPENSLYGPTLGGGDQGLVDLP